jgi:hypothetical protein
MPKWQELACAIQDQQPVNGLTHNFYRYPARFSPTFARQVILSFSEPGDLVFDPFMGGGTTLVEARALGRNAIGTDISSLAVFLAQTKTLILSDVELNRIHSWAQRLVSKLSLQRKAVRANAWADYQCNINGRATWRVRKMLELALNGIRDLETDKERELARCAILRLGQWALDCREEIPSAETIRSQFLLVVSDMVVGAKEYAKAARTHSQADVLCLNRSVVGFENDESLKRVGSPRLILTSPPYPGVHVLYHRWQVLGRRETPAPFWIAGTLDGAGASYYTFGDRGQSRLRKYYEQAKLAFSSISKIATKETFIAQMVAFSEPKWQLPTYLDVMTDCGFAEQKYPELANQRDGRVWRSVPNRKWYADKGGVTGGSKEVVLFHKRS